MSISGQIRTGLTAGLRHFAAAILPQSCFLCGQPGSGEVLCQSCREDLPRLPQPRCPSCALPTPGGQTCGGCLKAPPHFDASEAVFRYAFPVDKLVQALKYQHRLALADFFAAELGGERPEVDAILPMPLSPLRLRERGFNQAVEIARPLARRWGLPLLLDTCQRPREAPPQAMLPWQARRKNVRGSFECRADLSGLRLLVIDDVMTTGASLDELARTLKKHGAVRVINRVVARTLKE